MNVNAAFDLLIAFAIDDVETPHAARACDSVPEMVYHNEMMRSHVDVRCGVAKNDALEADQALQQQSPSQEHRRQHDGESDMEATRPDLTPRRGGRPSLGVAAVP